MKAHLSSFFSLVVISVILQCEGIDSKELVSVNRHEAPPRKDEVFVMSAYKEKLERMVNKAEELHSKPPVPAAGKSPDSDQEAEVKPEYKSRTPWLRKRGWRKRVLAHRRTVLGDKATKLSEADKKLLFKKYLAAQRANNRMLREKAKAATASAKASTKALASQKKAEADAKARAKLNLKVKALEAQQEALAAEKARAAAKALATQKRVEAATRAKTLAAEKRAEAAARATALAAEKRVEAAARAKALAIQKKAKAAAEARAKLNLKVKALEAQQEVLAAANARAAAKALAAQKRAEAAARAEALAAQKRAEAAARAKALAAQKRAEAAARAKALTAQRKAEAAARAVALEAQKQAEAAANAKALKQAEAIAKANALSKELEVQNKAEAVAKANAASQAIESQKRVEALATAKGDLTVEQLHAPSQDLVEKFQSDLSHKLENADPGRVREDMPDSVFKQEELVANAKPPSRKLGTSNSTAEVNDLIETVKKEHHALERKEESIVHQIQEGIDEEQTVLAGKHVGEGGHGISTHDVVTLVFSGITVLATVIFVVLIFFQWRRTMKSIKVEQIRSRKSLLTIRQDVGKLTSQSPSSYSSSSLSTASNYSLEEVRVDDTLRESLKNSSYKGTDGLGSSSALSSMISRISYPEVEGPDIPTLKLKELKPPGDHTTKSPTLFMKGKQDAEPSISTNGANPKLNFKNDLVASLRTRKK